MKVGVSIITKAIAASLVAGVCVAEETEVKGSRNVAHAVDKSDLKHGLRTISYNVLKSQGYPGQYGKQRKKVGLAIASELSLYKPDIVSLQEAPSETMVAMIAEELGMQYVFFEGRWPGAIITRFEVVESGPCRLPQTPKDLFTRHGGRALLDTGKEKIAFYSAHLMPHLKNEAIRTREITELLTAMKKDIVLGHSILFQGDLNHNPDGPEYQRWINAGFRDAAGEEKKDEFTMSSLKREQRIDYIWTYGSLTKRLLEYKVLAEGAFVRNSDDLKPSLALSDHIPVMATFK